VSPAGRRLVCALLATAALALVAEGAAASAASRPAISARAAALIEESSGRGLYGRTPDARLPIASATKLMTALIVIERARLNAIFTEPAYFPAANFSQIGLRPGERMSVHDLLIALLLPSADDAAEDLAFNVGHRSVARFISMMNARARQLGLTRTHYTTPIGLDTPGNYSSASDLVTLARFLLTHHPFFANAVALPHALLRTGDHQRVVANRNTLVGRVPWVNGVKTGHTLGAGYVLVGSGTRGGMTLISAVLGTPSEGARNAGTLAVLNYGFANFHIVTPVVAGRVVARPRVRDRPGAHADVIAQQTLTRVLPKSDRVTIRLQLPAQLAGPLARHAVVGHELVLVNGRVIARVPLLLAQRLPAVSPLTLAARFILRPFTLVLLALLLGGATVVALRRHGRAPRGRRSEAGVPQGEEA
jgi:D-alanyl-D-alanine carboxypeptidase (penicillin-binding protein 5/6)